MSACAFSHDKLSESSFQLLCSSAKQGYILMILQFFGKISLMQLMKTDFCIAKLTASTVMKKLSACDCLLSFAGF